MWARKWRNCSLRVPWAGMQNGAATVQKNMEVPPKLNIELPRDPAMPLVPGYVPERIESRNLKRYLFAGVQSSTVRKRPKVEAIPVSLFG